MTECSETLFPFEAHFSRQVVAQFEGSWLTTEGGSLLLRQADRKIGLLRRVARCFTDYRQPQRIEHRLEEMLAQRIYGLALGYEDLNDHEQLRQDQLLCARLRPSNIDASAGSLEEVQRIVTQIRKAWRHTQIILRADSGFCREELMAWCEQHAVDYVFGFARNQRLRRKIAKEMRQAKKEQQRTGEPARVFTEFFYQTRKTWSRSRRVVAKAEQIPGKENPRYVVTSLALAAWPTRELYEQLYCARGEMENRIKEQLSLFSDRMSTESLRSNQLRLYFSSLAYVLVEALRRLGLAGTEWAEAQVDTIRLRLLKIAAQVRITARRIWIRFSRAYPWQNLFAAACTALRC